jgi:hypothetical protein
MNNNTKVRLHLSKNLFESLSQQILAEAKKADMSGGAYTEAVKIPKAKKSPEVSKTNKMKTIGERNMEETSTMEEAKNPEADKAVQMLVKRLTDHWGHGDYKATIAAIRAALDRLEKSNKDDEEEE